MSSITFLSELWLKKTEINHLKDLCLNKKKFLFKSDMPDSKKNKGRPFGGIGLVFDSSFKVIEYSFLNRYLSFFHLKQNNFELIVIGAYMPFDDSKKRDESKSIYELTLSYIHVLIKKYKNLFIPVILLGDFNADLNRYSNNRFDSLLRNFVEDNNLIILDKIFPQKFNYTFSPNGHSSEIKSKIDNIFIPKSMYDCFINPKYEILNHVTNTSDHLAINMQFEYKLNESLMRSNEKSNFFRVTPDFENPLIYNLYNKYIEEELIGLEYLILNLKNDNQTNNQIQTDQFYSSLCQVFVTANKKTLEISKNNENQSRLNNHGKKGFGVECIDIKSKLITAEKKLKIDPSNLYQKDLIKTLQTKYRSAQRRSIYIEEATEVKKLENVAQEKDKKKFWKHVKRSRNKRNIQKTVTISNENLVDQYKNFFKETNEFTTEQKEISQKVKNLSESYNIPENLILFNIYQIQIILDELKSSQVRGHDSIFYDLIKNCHSNKLKDCLLSFFNQLLSTNTIPNNFNISIIKPILKDTDKSSEDKNNIRPISISNCFAQFLEKLILLNSPKLKIINKNQYGFKHKTSCNHAIFTVKETILHYTENDSGVIVASLDAEKAFDKVWRDGLFFKLIDKMECSIWNLLKKYYDSSKGVILDEITNTFSDPFDIETGVKQGGHLSSYEYNVLVDELIQLIIDMDTGAHIGDINVSIIVYADDILIICPRSKHLQNLLDMCAEYGKKWLIKFNALKSKIVEFGEQIITNNSFQMNGNEIPIVEEIVYLGVTLNKKLNYDSISRENFKKVQKSVFSLSFLGLKPKAISPFLQAFIYKTYCLSLYTYSLETTALTKESRNFINTAQNNLIRQILGLNFSCHISKILNCLKLHTFHDLYIKTKLSFIRTLCYNENSQKIFNYLIINKKTSFRSKSFKKDITLLEEIYNKDILVITQNAKNLEKELIDKFQANDGITDSIRTCLFNYKDKTHSEMLDDLIKPNFIRDDEEFQNLLQYFIIMDNNF